MTEEALLRIKLIMYNYDKFIQTAEGPIGDVSVQCMLQAMVLADGTIKRANEKYNAMKG